MITSYKGIVYSVPNWTKYIAADEDGMVMAHEEMPEKWAHEWAPQKGARWEVLADSINPCADDAWGEPKRV